MLVLTRLEGQGIKINDNIIIRVVQVQSAGKVRIGIEAPSDMLILREELEDDGRGACGSGGNQGSPAAPPAAHACLGENELKKRQGPQFLGFDITK